MKKITKLMLALVLCVVGAGVNSVKAERVYGSLSVVYQATWDPSTNTMGWTKAGAGEWYILRTGLPTGDITSYTTFHATLSDFSDNADFIRLIIKDGTNEDVVRLVEGENDIDLSTLTNCDYTKITEIYLWGSDAAKDGKTINAENPASVVVTDVYMERPDQPFVVSTGGFGDEFTSLEDITDGTKFVIGDGTNVMYWTTASVDGKKANVKVLPKDSYYFYKLNKVEGLDLNNDGVEDDDNYTILIVNSNENEFTHAWNLGSYLNYSKWGHLFAGSGKSKAQGGTYDYGGDGDYYAIWKVVYVDGNGFYLKNAGVNKYATLAGSSNDVTYLKFYKSVEFEDVTKYPANDEIFSFSKATGYDAATGEGTNIEWNFETPVDLSNWKYLIIAMENGCADKSLEISLKDNFGTTVKGEDYVGVNAGTGPNLWFSHYNHQNIACINLDYVKENVLGSNTKALDIKNFKSLKIPGTTKPSVVYLSNYDNPNLLSTNRWSCYKEGNLKREYVKSQVGKFGTICLPYKASCAGAEIYSIESNNGSGISLTKVTGLMEAGKPYFYKACDMVGKDNGGDKENPVDIHNVNFFRADFDNYDAAKPITNNGLVGTFTNTTAPQGENYYVLYSNELYQVDSDVPVDANKAYIDASKVINKSEAKSRAFINFEGQATGIAAIENNDAVNVITNAAIYNLNGQRVMNPTRGIYIVNGKKLFIK